MSAAKHILFVEDESDFREGLSTLLELKGFRVGWASNGRQGLDYLRQGERPDLILLDLKLPDMDGWQFRREQQHDPTPGPHPGRRGLGHEGRGPECRRPEGGRLPGEAGRVR